MTKRNVKKVVVTKNRSRSSSSVQKSRSKNTGEETPLLYGKKNYKLMLFGVFLIALGFLLMSGGHMPSPDVWDEDLIYSFRRITLAPIIILAGLGIEVYAIFKS